MSGVMMVSSKTFPVSNKPHPRGRGAHALDPLFRIHGLELNFLIFVPSPTSRAQPVQIVDDLMMTESADLWHHTRSTIHPSYIVTQETRSALSVRVVYETETGGQRGSKGRDEEARRGDVPGTRRHMV